MTDGSSSPEILQDPHQFYIEVQDLSLVFDRVRSGRSGNLSRTEFAKHPIFAGETSGVEQMRGGQYSISTNLTISEQRRVKPDKGYYSSMAIDKIRNLIEQEGFSVSIMSKKGMIRDLFVMKGDICVRIGLGAQKNKNDEIYRNIETEEFVKKMIEQSGEPYFPSKENFFMSLELVDSNTLGLAEISYPAFPKIQVELEHAVKVYAEIYESFIIISRKPRLRVVDELKSLKMTFAF